MTEYTVSRDGGRWWKFRLGFGRLHRARAIAYVALPERVRRAQAANPGLTAEEAFNMIEPAERVAYETEVVLATLNLVLDEAQDWNIGMKAKAAYVDEDLPEDVAAEIYSTVQRALLGDSLPQESKKN